MHHKITINAVVTRKRFEYLTLTSLIPSLPVTRCGDHNTDLPSYSNVLRTVRVNIAFTITFSK